MRVLFIGDIHTKQYIIDNIKELDNKYNFDKIICTGDYCDDWRVSGQKSLDLLDQIFELKDSNPNKYTFLIGNHELSYLGHPCSGHNYEYEKSIENKLKHNLYKLDLYYSIDLNGTEYFCSHAGFTDEFIYNELDGLHFKDTLKKWNNDKLQYLDKLSLCSYLRGGSSPYSSFLWCDAKELLLSKTNLIPYQIVGHTPITMIVPDEDIIFIDSHSTHPQGFNIGDKSYLFWNENKFEVLNIVDL